MDEELEDDYANREPDANECLREMYEDAKREGEENVERAVAGW
jgi:hypothetical protein